MNTKKCYVSIEKNKKSLAYISENRDDSRLDSIIDQYYNDDMLLIKSIKKIPSKNLKIETIYYPREMAKISEVEEKIKDQYFDYKLADNQLRINNKTDFQSRAIITDYNGRHIEKNMQPGMNYIDVDQLFKGALIVKVIDDPSNQTFKFINL